jgi:GTP pyrophosphokinase
MRELAFLPDYKQQRIAKETLDIFAPIAGRLGISQIKCELEDLCLKYIDPLAYEYLAKNIQLKRQERHEMVDDFIAELKEKVKSVVTADFEISGRTKHFYSIYKKMKRQNKTLDQIYDMTAVRIIVDSVLDCYAVLGAIHEKWHPIQGRIKDYIAVPKPNMYQSLHTTVTVSEGVHNTPFEVQIRTFEMHRVAEYGIAAHWKYKEGVTEVGAMDEKLGWVKEVLSYETELKDSTEFLDIIRNDISNTNEVYVFTPGGDVKSLIAGANALDFAYSIHSGVGNKCVGAKINNKIMPLSTELKTGDIVEIMTNPNSKGPSRDWLKIVKTSSAKAKIRQFFRHELNDEYIKTGKSMIERESKHRGIAPSELLTNEAIQGVCERYMLNNADEMYAAVGYGSLTLNQVVTKLVASNSKVSDAIRIQQIARRKKTGTAPENSVIIKGMDDLLVRFSRCCSPVPGDEIVGYISRGRGVCVHRTDCPAVKGMEEERLVPAEWVQTQGNATFQASIQILMEDKGFILTEITKVISSEGLDMTSVNARKDKKGNAVAIITVEINNHDQVNQLITKLNQVKHVISARRTTSL